MSERFKTHAAVFVGLRNDDGELLLQERANTGYMDGHYDLSCSGHLEDNESVRQAAIRELREELGIEADEKHLRLVHINQNNLDNKPYLNFIFMLDEWTGEPVVGEPDKCSDLRYFALDDLPGKCTLNVNAYKASGFSQELTYSYIDETNYEEVMGEPYQR